MAISQLHSEMFLLQFYIIQLQNMPSRAGKNEDIDKKQAYLRKNVIDQGYDAQQFVNHCISKYGEVDVGSWSMQTLKRIVKQYVAIIQQTNKFPQQQKICSEVNVYQSQMEQDDQDWDSENLPKKEGIKNQKQNDRCQEAQTNRSNRYSLKNNYRQKTAPAYQIISAATFRTNQKNVALNADWEIFGILESKPKKMVSDKQIDFSCKQKTNTDCSRDEQIFPQKLSLPNTIKSSKEVILTKRIKSNSITSLGGLNTSDKKSKKQKIPEIPYTQYQHKRTKIKVRENIAQNQLPHFNDVIVLKTQQVSKGFLQSDFTLYHFVFKPTNHVIKRKFNDLRRLRSILHKMYPTFRLPYLEPEGWLHNTSQGKDPELLSKYKYMSVQFLKYITMTNQQLKNTQIVKEFLGLGKKIIQKEQQFAKKVLDDFNRLPKPKAIHDLSLRNPQLLLQPNPNFTKYIANHQNLMVQVDTIYDKLKKQLQTLYYSYDQVSKAFIDIATTFQQLQAGIVKFNIQNRPMNDLKVYDGIKEMLIKFQNNINDRHNLIKSRMGALFKYQKENMWTIRQIIDQRNKIHSQFIRNGSPQNPIIRHHEDIYKVTAILPLQQIVKGDKNCISIQNNFWQQTCVKQIQRYWKTLRAKINENLSLFSYDELDMETQNLNFWNNMIKKCLA